METTTQLEEYRSRLVDFRNSFAVEIDQGIEIIGKLQNELDATKNELRQTKLDLESESDQRRLLQEENNERKQTMAGRPFVVALIDADPDCYVFHDRFITRGEEGGRDAADALSAAMLQYVRESLKLPDKVDVVVKAFANVAGLGNTLEKNGKLGNVNEMRQFAAEFSNRRPFFDFVDVGYGKDRADVKVQESLNFFLDSFQCKHVVVACGHDGGYAPRLGHHVGDEQIADRITLLAGSQFLNVFRNLRYRTTWFDSVFVESAQSVKRPSTRGQQQWSTMPARNMNNRETTALGQEKPFQPRRNPQAQTQRLGPVSKNENGQRVDRPLSVPVSVVEGLRSASLCYYLSLRGECALATCKRRHEYWPLSDAEYDALWLIAREGRCRRNRDACRNGSDDCSDAKCVYGHTPEEEGRV